MVYNYKKQRSPIVPMYTILGTSDGVPEKNGEDTRASKQQIRKIEDTPAPNSYNIFGYRSDTTIGSQNSTMRTAPQFSFGVRSNLPRGYGFGPGPQYNVTKYLGTYISNICNKTPSMKGRIPVPIYHRSPGPEYLQDYDTIYSNTSPHYSFGIRHSLPRAPIIVDKPE